MYHNNKYLVDICKPYVDCANLNDININVVPQVDDRLPI